MQSALGSLRNAGPTKSIKSPDGRNSTFYGVGSDHLVLSGHYDFRVIRGAVALCGVTLSSGPALYHVSAPVAPFPCLEAVHARSDANADLETVPDLEEFAAVLEVIESSTPPNVSQLAPPFRGLWHALHRVDTTARHIPLVQTPASWRSIDLIQRHAIILGPKNAGKSGLAKYLCNQALLSREQGRVFYLELDPGQPEYSPPGCLALHQLDRASPSSLNFSPAYAHPNFTHAVKAHNFGYNSPGETPHRYLAICEDLYQAYVAVADRSDILIVNTPGWTKGLGLELTTSLAELVQPATIIHMGASEYDISDVLVVDKIEHSADPSLSTTITTGGYSSAELRALQLISYMHQQNQSHPTQWAPFEVPLGVRRGGVLAFAVLDALGINLEDDLAICVEGTVVSINVITDPSAISQVEGPIVPPSLADDVWKISRCAALAIVQSLSLENNCIRLLVPIDPAELDLGEKTIVLCRGRIQLPVWELQDKELGPEVPWVFTTKPVGIGGSYTKFRRNIQR